MALPFHTEPIVIAIDGYSSCGKSTLARQLASCFNCIYIDTGAMYRAVTLFLLDNRVDINEMTSVEKSLDNIHISFVRSGGSNITYLNGVDVEEQIRSLEVSQYVSEVAALSVVRKKMVALQRIMAGHNSVVMDGRDIGTVVFPNAKIKFFLTADDNVRAQRRLNELHKKGDIHIKLEEVLTNLRHRDMIDTSRKDSPLRQAEDAYLIDSTNLSIEDQLEVALQYIKMKISD